MADSDRDLKEIRAKNLSKAIRELDIMKLRNKLRTVSGSYTAALMNDKQ